MKKIIVLLLAAAIALSCMTGVAFAAEDDNLITLSFTIDENPGFATFGAQLVYYSAALELVSFEEGSLLSGKGMFLGNPANGMVTFVAMGTNVTGTGELFTATFKIRKEAEIGSYPVTVKLDEKATVDASYNPVAFAIQGGTIEVDHEHTWSEWTVVTEATCTEDGLKTCQCVDCGFENEEVIPSPGHQYGRWEFDEDGHWHTCARCGEPGDYAEHDKQMNPETQTDGENKEICTVCDWNVAEEVTPTEPTQDVNVSNDGNSDGDNGLIFIVLILCVVALVGCVAALFIIKHKKK